MLAPPHAVWDALADPDWPAAGSRFHHKIGVGPLTIADHTESIEARPPELLRLRAKGRPLGTATVTLELLPRDGGTLVRITELLDGAGRVLSITPLVHLATKARNAESLMRLEELALRR